MFNMFVQNTQCSSLPYSTAIGSSLILNIYIPPTPTLLVDAILMTSAVPDIGITPKSVPSPLLNPTWAGFPPRPLTPPSASPVVHCISPSAYKYMAYVSVPCLSVASTH